MDLHSSFILKVESIAVFLGLLWCVVVLSCSENRKKKSLVLWDLEDFGKVLPFTQE